MSHASTTSRIRPETIATVATYLLQGALAALIFSVYQGTDQELLDTTSGSVRLLAYSSLGGAVLAAVLLAVAFRAAGSDRRTQFWFPAGLSLVFGAFGAIVLEVGIRVIAKPDPLGARVGATILLPYDWNRLAEFNGELLRKSRLSSAYYVEDERLGWAIGRNRTSDDGLYASSAEGLRSERPGISYATTSAGRRVMVLGDSFAFSEEVSWNDSLARHLSESLPPDGQVLNFGVPGYGLDQAVLRYEIAADEWQPSVAVLTFIQDDLNRMVNVYTFLKVGWGLPLSKPRFVLDGVRPKLLNSPTLDPDEIFGSTSIFDLPLLDYEIEFFARQWERQPLHASFLFRYLVSRVPVWPPANEHTSTAAIAALSSALIHRFMESARAAGTVPLVVYFPSRGDFAGLDRGLKTRVIDSLATEGVHVTNITECVRERAAAGLFVASGVHYSGDGNRAVARCLQPLIEQALLESAQ
jgi:hypothetical protein